MSSSPVVLERPRSEAELVARLADRGPALVALSGGVDSSLVASFALEALGPDSLAVTLAGPAVARSEVDRARSVARTIGIAHEVVPVDPLVRAEYRANPPDRCYHCRSIETEVLGGVALARGLRQRLDGVHRDDLADDRPGLRAMDEAGFDHPLAWAGWGKAMVRSIARERGLPNWDQPSDACLASRVAHGEPITPELLERIETGEAWIAARGFRRVRLRTRAGAARVEVDPEDVVRLASEPLLSELRAALERLGFRPVDVDPAGYGAARPRPGASR